MWTNFRDLGAEYDSVKITRANKIKENIEKEEYSEAIKLLLKEGLQNMVNALSNIEPKKLKALAVVNWKREVNNWQDGYLLSVLKEIENDKEDEKKKSHFNV